LRSSLHNNLCEVLAKVDIQEANEEHGKAEEVEETDSRGNCVDNCAQLDRNRCRSTLSLIYRGLYCVFEYLICVVADPCIAGRVFTKSPFQKMIFVEIVNEEGKESVGNFQKEEEKVKRWEETIKTLEEQKTKLSQ